VIPRERRRSSCRSSQSSTSSTPLIRGADRLLIESRCQWAVLPDEPGSRRSRPVSTSVLFHMWIGVQGKRIWGQTRVDDKSVYRVMEKHVKFLGGFRHVESQLDVHMEVNPQVYVRTRTVVLATRYPATRSLAERSIVRVAWVMLVDRKQGPAIRSRCNAG